MDKGNSVLSTVKMLEENYAALKIFQKARKEEYVLHHYPFTEDEEYGNREQYMTFMFHNLVKNKKSLRESFLLAKSSSGVPYNSRAPYKILSGEAVTNAALLGKTWQFLLEIGWTRKKLNKMIENGWDPLIRKGEIIRLTNMNYE